ncbi:MAG: hypothetical protein WDM76_06370 [Limisphaerales bacterium]
MSFLRPASLVAVALIAVSCSSLPPPAIGPRFHEGAAANLVLIYYGNQSIYMTKPDTRENGFLPLLSRQDVLHSLERPEIGHDLAVIVVGTLTAEAEAALMQDWESVLKEQGFRRVVWLASGNTNDIGIDGLLILHDSVIAIRNVQPTDTVAPFPPAAGTHVAHPSTPPVR